MNIKVSFYDYYGQLNSDQIIVVADELASLNMSLSELESYGVIVPVLNDITIMNKTYVFTKFEYHLSKIEDDDYRYIFWAKYVAENLILPHYNNKVDKLEETVDRLGVDINSFIYENNDIISKLKDKVQNWDKYQELADELQLVIDKNDEHTDDIAAITASDFSSQISTLNESLDDLSVTLDTAHDGLEYDMSTYDDALLNHQNEIDYIKNILSNRVKHVFLSNSDYASLPNKNMNTLYFTI